MKFNKPFRQRIHILFVFRTVIIDYQTVVEKFKFGRLTMVENSELIQILSSKQEWLQNRLKI